MPRKFNDIKIIEDIKNGIKIKDIMIKYKINENNKKECCICHQEKELKEYNKNNNSRDKHKSQCRLCQSLINKNNYHNKKQLKIINVCL
jgi:hypothetical protein